MDNLLIEDGRPRCRPSSFRAFVARQQRGRHDRSWARTWPGTFLGLHCHQPMPSSLAVRVCAGPIPSPSRPESTRHPRRPVAPPRPAHAGVVFIGAGLALAMSACTPTALPSGGADAGYRGILCGESFIDPRSDPNNCGRCYNRCLGSERCMDARCRSEVVNPCPLNLSPCGGDCVDTTDDPRHCGGCDRSCGDAACVNGDCQSVITTDAGPRDAGPRDAGPRDAGPRDAGPRDAGPSCTTACGTHAHCVTSGCACDEGYLDCTGALDSRMGCACGDRCGCTLDDIDCGAGPSNYRICVVRPDGCTGWDIHPCHTSTVCYADENLCAFGAT